MLRKKQRRKLTEEQIKRIMDEPGVIVHRNNGPVKDPVFEPKFRVDIPIRASELTDAQDDDECWSAEQ